MAGQRNSLLPVALDIALLLLRCCSSLEISKLDRIQVEGTNSEPRPPVKNSPTHSPALPSPQTNPHRHGQRLYIRQFSGRPSLRSIHRTHTSTPFFKSFTTSAHGPLISIHLYRTVPSPKQGHLRRPSKDGRRTSPFVDRQRDGAPRRNASCQEEAVSSTVCKRCALI